MRLGPLHPPSEQYDLSTLLAVWLQVLLSLEVYLMLPYLLHSLRPTISVAAAVICSLACCGLLLSSPPILHGFIAAVCFVTFMCPLWLVAMQRRSANFSGPWDVAEVDATRRC